MPPQRYRAGQRKLSAAQLNDQLDLVAGLAGLQVTGNAQFAREGGSYTLNVGRDEEGFWARLDGEGAGADAGTYDWTEMELLSDGTFAVLDGGRSGTVGEVTGEGADDPLEEVNRTTGVAAGTVVRAFVGTAESTGTTVDPTVRNHWKFLACTGGGGGGGPPPFGVTTGPGWVNGLRPENCLRLTLTSAAGVCVDVDLHQQITLFWNGTTEQWESDPGDDFITLAGSYPVTFKVPPETGFPVLKLGTFGLTFDRAGKLSPVENFIDFAGGNKLCCGDGSGADVTAGLACTDVDCLDNVFIVRLVCVTCPTYSVFCCPGVELPGRLCMYVGSEVLDVTYYAAADLPAYLAGGDPVDGWYTTTPRAVADGFGGFIYIYYRFFTTTCGFDPSFPALSDPSAPVPGWSTSGGIGAIPLSQVSCDPFLGFNPPFGFGEPPCGPGGECCDTYPAGSICGTISLVTGLTGMPGSMTFSKDVHGNIYWTSGSAAMSLACLGGEWRLGMYQGDSGNLSYTMVGSPSCDPFGVVFDVAVTFWSTFGTGTFRITFSDGACP